MMVMVLGKIYFYIQYVTKKVCILRMEMQLYSPLSNIDLFLRYRVAVRYSFMVLLFLPYHPRPPITNLILHSTSCLSKIVFYGQTSSIWRINRLKEPPAVWVTPGKAADRTVLARGAKNTWLWSGCQFYVATYNMRSIGNEERP